MRAEHPELADLVDHARGLGTPAWRDTLDRHLGGCAACRRTAAQFVQVAQVAGLGAAYEPSPAAVRIAESIAARFRPDPVTTLPRLVARLIGGGLPMPALAGVRAGAARPREAEWQAGGYGLRVRVERDRQSPALSIVGQLDGPAPDHAGAAGLPVRVTSGRHVVGRTDTNAFGEFVVTCDAAPRLRLHVAIAGGAQRVSVPLARLLHREGA
jgi:hypothetical protein